MQSEIDYDPVERLTTDAIGKPGNRVFYLQAVSSGETITLLIEKLQVTSLAVGIEKFLTEVEERFPQFPPASRDYVDDEMRIAPPVDPLFRVGEISIMFDAERDMSGLVVTEIDLGLEETDEQPQRRTIRLWCTRSQLKAMAHWGLQVANQGRQIFPQCGEPMDPEGHFCPKKNGHKRN